MFLDEIMNGAPPDAFDDVLKNANKIDTKVNEEKIEAEFRRLFKVRAEDLIRKEAKISAEDVKLQPNKEKLDKTAKPIIWHVPSLCA